MAFRERTCMQYAVPYNLKHEYGSETTGLTMSVDLSVRWHMESRNKQTSTHGPW